MDKIINWFMMLIIFVFDPLAIAMVVAANMAFAKLKPKVECSVPEGMEFDVSYPLKEEIQEDEVIEKEVIKEYVKLPKESKGWIIQAAKHAGRRGDKIPNNIDRFFED